MLNSSEKFKADIKEIKNIQKLEKGLKLNKDLLIADENINFNHKIILFDLKLEKKLLDISFHNEFGYITSFHIIKRPLYIDNKQISFSNDSFYFFSSSIDGKFLCIKYLIIIQQRNFRIIN